MKKLLIFEDDYDLVAVIGYIFKESGFEVINFGSGIPLVEIIEINPNIIIIDHQLGNQLGNELCLAIKEHPSIKHIPIIMFSAAIDIKKLAMESCADTFVDKPFDIIELESLVLKLAL